MTGGALESQPEGSEATAGAERGGTLLGAKRALLRVLNVVMVAVVFSGAGLGLVALAEAGGALSDESTTFFLLAAFLVVLLPVPLAYLAVRRWAWAAPERLASRVGVGLAAACVAGGSWAFALAGLQAVSWESWTARLALGVACWLLLWVSLGSRPDRAGATDSVVDLTGALLAFSVGLAAYCVVGLLVGLATGDDLLDGSHTGTLKALAWFGIPVVALAGLVLRRPERLSLWMDNRPRFFSVLRAGAFSTVALFLAYTLAGARAVCQLRSARPDLIAFAVWAVCLVTPLVWLTCFRRSTGGTAWRWAMVTTLLVVVSTLVLVEPTRSSPEVPRTQHPPPSPTPLARTYVA